MRSLVTLGLTTAHGAAINAYPAQHQGVMSEVGKHAQIASPHEWPLLERAVEQKIEEQAEFVQWWRDRVTPRQSPGRNGQSNADPRSISKSDAESLTGITQQQVSKWAKRLKDEGKPALSREVSV